ncbi:hypothetical protein BKA70DRAFT_1267072 [Coprinopsis sp. MPI-PUGE-AT-0042]|nr:hypothetical protein BKA70DRAFT_1267072 [Coprinopsis sp. MPI-PUGE-AT-0042]
MHQCLIIAEVLDTIFSDTWCSPRMLARLARTCKAFHEPAVRNLWKHLRSFSPVLNLLSPEVLSRDTEGCHETINLFRWSLVYYESGFKRSLARIYDYTRHVRKLDWMPSCKWSKRYGVHHAAFRKLYEHEDLARPLFPNLREVELPYSTRDPLVAVFYPSLVLSHSVQKITVTCDICELIDLSGAYGDLTDDWWKALAGRLRTVASTLREFEVCSDDFEANTLVGRVRVLEQSIPDFSAITRLKISSLVLDQSTLISLGRGHLSWLVNLSLLVTAQMNLQFPTDLSFPALEKLSLTTLSFDSCSIILAHLSANRLKRFKLKAAMDSDEEGNAIDTDYDPEPLFRTLHGRGMHGHLEQIHLKKIWVNGDVTAVWSAYRNEQRFTVTPRTLRSLIPFTSVTSFTIDTCDTSALDDQTLGALFEHWPRLECFKLSDETFSSEQPLLTLHGVHRAVSHVPALENLTLRFDARSIPEDSVLAPCFEQHPSLQFLDVAASTLDAASLGHDLASWLQRHYPRPKRVQSLTRYRNALDSVYENGEADEDEREIFQPYIGLATMVDRWNDVTYAFKS